MSVTLSGTLPNDDRDGIGAINRALLDDPESTHLIVARVNCSRIVNKVDNGDIIPTARILAIEGFPWHTVPAKQLDRILRSAYGQRTGKAELPLDAGEDSLREHGLINVDEGDGPTPIDDPALLAEAAELVIRSQFASTSMLQRKLRVGLGQGRPADGRARAVRRRRPGCGHQAARHARPGRAARGRTGADQGRCQVSNPNVYGPGKAAQSGDRLDELVRRSLRLREHLWIATAAWLVPEPGRPGERLLDRENLLVSPEIGCYVCEEPWSPRLERRRCSGQSKPGPAPLLPGGDVR